MEWLIGLASSSGLGAIVGMIGGLAEKWVDTKAKALEYRHEAEMRKIDVKESELERAHELAFADKQIERAEVEGDIKIQQIDASAFVESQKSQGRSKLLTYVRASITAFVLLAATVLSIIVWNSVGGLDAFDASQLEYLLTRIVEATLFLATTCVAWWFATRPSNMQFRK